MTKSPSSKADTAVKLVLIFFISLLSFSVGTYVGKQVSETEVRQAALEADYNGEESASADDELADVDDATAPLTDEEARTLAEEYVDTERKTASDDKDQSENTKYDGYSNDHGSGHGEASALAGTGHKEAAEAKSGHSAPAAKSAGAHGEEGYTHRSKMNAQNHEDVVSGSATAEKHNDQSAWGEKAQARHAAAETAPKSAIEKHSAKSAIKEEASKAADRVANDMAPAADPKKTPPAPTTLPSVATTAIGKYTVQVASYATETEAKEFATKLTTKGYSAFYVPAEVNGKTWYRVSVGLFADQKSATNYRTELLATQVVSSAIVQKIVK